MKQERGSVVKQAFGKLQNTFWKAFHKTLYYTATSVRFVFSHDEKYQQKMTCFNVKVSVTLIKPFKCTASVLHNVILHVYNTKNFVKVILH